MKYEQFMLMQYLARVSKMKYQTKFLQQLAIELRNPYSVQKIKYY